MSLRAPMLHRGVAISWTNNINKLVYYEVFEDPESAIPREKQIKAGSRQKKLDLIDSVNKEWRDLYEEL